MFVKDPQGKWYEVDEKLLKDKQVNEAKAREAIIAERAEKRRKVIDVIASFDLEELAILRDQLLGSIAGRIPTLDCVRRPWGGPYWGAGGTPDCDCQAPTPNCDCQAPTPNCDCQAPTPNCDCQGPTPNCDCNSTGYGSWGGGMMGSMRAARRFNVTPGRSTKRNR